jgi:hypothetical protein
MPDEAIVLDSRMACFAKLRMHSDSTLKHLEIYSDSESETDDDNLDGINVEDDTSSTASSSSDSDLDSDDDLGYARF